jgi:hypothetical protein
MRAMPLNAAVAAGMASVREVMHTFQPITQVIAMCSIVLVDDHAIVRKASSV